MHTTVRLFFFICFGLGIWTACGSLNQPEPKKVSKEAFVISEPMEPAVFREAWGGDSSTYLVSYDSLSLKNLPISKSAKAFLSQAGLPKSCQPSLFFDERLYAEDLRNIKDVLALKNNDLIHQYVIGSAETGMIYIDSQDDDKVKIMDIAYAHRIDTRNTSGLRPDYIPQMFMNSSVGHLAHCLLIYRQFVAKTRAVRNNQYFADFEPTDQELEDVRKELLQADPNCLSEKSFWTIETATNPYKDIKGPSGVKFN